MSTETIEILQTLLPEHGFNVDEVTINLITSDMSIEAEREAVNTTWELWDKETPINGVSADEILARPDYPGGEIYLIYINGALAVLQPHAPREGMHAMSVDEANRAAEKRALAMAEDFARISLLSKVIPRLEAAGMNATP